MKNDITNNNLINLSEKEKTSLLSYITQSDIRQLRSMPLHSFNLNYLTSSTDIQFDQMLSPLLAACYIGKPEIFLLIMNNEYIDLNMASSPEEYSPLMVACYKGYYEIVRMLLEKNANVSLSNRNGQFPFVFCFSRLEQTSYKYENRKICMMLIDLLLSYGADINVRFNTHPGYTVLMKLCMQEINNNEKCENLIELIKFLIERGANPNELSYDNKNIYDLLSLKSLPEYRERIIDTIKTTNQVMFFNDDSMIDMIPIVNNKRRKIILQNSNDIVLETNEMKVTCCVIF